MEDKIDRVTTAIHCKDGATPLCRMIDFTGTEPKFISIRLEVGDTDIAFFVQGLFECAAFRDSVVRSCDELARRIVLKEEEEEREKEVKDEES